MVPDRQLVRPLLVVVPAGPPPSRRVTGGLSHGRRATRIVVGEDWISEHYFTTDAKSESFQAKVARTAQGVGRGRRGPATTPAAVHAFARGARPPGAASADLADSRRRRRTADASCADLYARPRRRCSASTRASSHVERDGPASCGSRRRASPGRRRWSIVEARPAETVEDLLAKDARTLLTAVRRRRQRRDARRWRGCCRRCSSRTTAPEFALVLAGRWAAARRAGALGRGPLPRRRPAARLRAQRHQERRRDRPRPDLRVAPSRSPRTPTATSGGSGVLEESVKHTVGVSKDLREGVRLSIEIIANEVVQPPAGAGTRPAARKTRRSRSPGRRCGSCTGSCSCSTRRRRPSSGAAGRRAGVRPGLQPRPAPRPALVELATPARQIGHPPLRLARPCCSAWSTRAHRRRAETATTTAQPAEGLVFNALRADLFQPEATALIDEVGLGNAALQRVLRHLLLSKEATGQGPRLHLLRRARHQPARRGVRGPDVVHRLLRRGRPVRGRQGRRPAEGLLGGPGRPRRRHRRDDFVTRRGRGHRRAEAGPAPARARSSSGSPAGNGSSRRRTTRPRC